MRRRRFLGFAAGAAMGTATGVPVSRTLSDLTASLNPSVYPPRGPETFVLSVCKLCPGGCGIRARRVGDRVVKLEGNPRHPVNGGRLCPRGQAALQSLYHPDRFPGPLKRVGSRGSLASFERASWEEAIGQIGARLRSLREQGIPESLVFIRGREHGLAARLAQRFLSAFGSPNDVVLHRGDESASRALELGQGIRKMPAHDVKAAEYVLSFGCALLEASSSPVHSMRSYGEFRQGRPGRRGKLVQVEPRLSLTAVAADEWIPVLPGSEGILALGVAGVLVAEGLYNRSFVSERTSGFEDLRIFLDRDFSLERVSRETNVAVNTILRVARELASSRSPLALGPRLGPLLPGSLLDHLAAHWLNALVGNLDSSGGVLVPEEVPLAPWPDLPADPIAEAGRARPRLDASEARESWQLRSDPEQIAEAILSGSPYPPEVLMIFGADPAFACAAPDRYATALERIPLVVSFASLPDDSALLADWILPEAHFLEDWDLDTTPAGVPFPLVSLAQPAREPLHEVRSAAQILLDLAAAIGGEVAASFPWDGLESLIRAEVDALYRARRGAVMGTEFDEAWVLLMERAGWWAPGYRSSEELWERMQETGGWWDPFYDHSNWQRVLRTPSGRYEFRVEVMKELCQMRSRSLGAVEAEQGLRLLLFEPLPVAGGTGAELPFLQEILDPAHEERWETWAEIHPETAHSLGIRDKDWVRIESSDAEIVARARVTERVVPGVAAVPVGLGKKQGGRWARGVGSNPLKLLSGEANPLSGLPVSPHRVRVRVLGSAEQERQV